MISPVSGYNINGGSFTGAKIVNAIPVKHRGEILPENVGKKFIQNAKGIFFEMFPKLDPEYEKVMKNNNNSKVSLIV